MSLFGYVYVLNTIFCLYFVFQVSDKNALFNLMFLDLDEHPEKVEGVGQLLFEMCKGVRNMFHSCTGKVHNREEDVESICKGLKKKIEMID